MAMWSATQRSSTPAASAARADSSRIAGADAGPMLRRKSPTRIGSLRRFQLAAVLGQVGHDLAGLFLRDAILEMADALALELDDLLAGHLERWGAGESVGGEPAKPHGAIAHGRSFDELDAARLETAVERVDHLLEGRLEVLAAGDRPAERAERLIHRVLGEELIELGPVVACVTLLE